MGVTLRSYGNVEIEADSVEAALPLLTADYVGENIDITETATDSGMDLAIIDVAGEDGAEIEGWDGHGLPSPYDPKPNAKLLAFVEMIARLSASGDAVDPDGDPCPNGYEHDTGSSLDALDELIHKARALAAIPEPSPVRDILDWSGPEEDTIDLTVWITTGDGEEIMEVQCGDVERNKEIAQAVVDKVNAMPWPLEPGTVQKLVKEAVEAEGRANG
ncbi:MAG: hypothetical protein AB7I52_17465 [Rhizobiaceae bacterium]